MKINIVTSEETTVTIDDVTGRTTVDEILAKIPEYEQDKISSPLLIPTLIQGKELKKGSTLGEMKIKNQTTLFYTFQRLKSMKIFIVNTSNQKTMMLECASSSTIGRIKDMISNRWDIPSKAQRLSFMGHRVLDDNRTLSHYKVHSDSLLQLKVFMNIIITDQATAADIVTFEATPAFSMSTIKRRIEDKLKVYGVSPEQIGVNVLKAKVHDPRDYYKDTTLNLMLHFFDKEFRIFVDETNFDCNSQRKDIKLFTFKVEPTDTVENVYTMINNKLGTGIDPWKDPDHGKSIYPGQWPCIGRLPGDGGILLSTIYRKSPFDLNLLTQRGGMLIFAEPKRPKTITLRVASSYTVSKIKDLIKTSGFCDVDLGLSFGNVDLKDSFTLSYYKIGEDAELNLKRLPIPQLQIPAKRFYSTGPHF